MNATILVAEDNTQNRYMLGALLRGHGYDTIAAADGADALKAANEHPPDLIISDILMPVMDGFTLCRRCKADARLQHIPFIFYTATYTDPMDKQLADGLGAARFLVKPLEPEALVAVVREVLNENDRSPAPAATREPDPGEIVLLEKHSRALGRKLEDKMLQLEAANRRLERRGVELARRGDRLGVLCNRQQHLAAFSRRAVAEPDLSAVCDEAVCMVSEALDVEFGEVLERVAGGDTLLLHAGIGWHAGLVQITTLDASAPSLAGYVLRSAEPVVIEDLGRESRFRPSRLLLNHAVTSGIAVAIRGRERPYGIIGVYTAARRTFGNDDARFLHAVANVLAAAIERRLAEEERGRLQAALQRSEIMAAMGTIVADVAHEVRNPLFGISATLDAFEARFGSQAGFIPYFTVLRRELQRLNDLMRDLLEYGKPRALTLARDDIGDVIGEAIRSCELLAQQSDIRVTFTIDSACEALPMDRARLRQVFENVIRNAIQHSPKGTQVSVEARPAHENENVWVECRVADSGDGFEEKDLPKIFEPFLSRRSGGTGLGLSIARRIVREHGGTIAAHNRPGGGGVVTTRLKVRSAHERPMPSCTAGPYPIN